MATTQILGPVLAFAKHHPFVILLSAFCVYLLSNRYQRKLHRIPGPWLRSISTIPRMWSVYRGRSHEDDLALHRKYGKIVRVAPNTLSISDPQEINQIYGAGTKFYKSRFFELSAVYDEEGLVPDTFVLADKELHSRMKRNAANAYSMNGVVQMESWLDGPTERLLQILGEHAAKQTPCDLGELLKRYAMDAVFSLTFGKDLDFLRKGDQTGMMKTIEVFTDYMAIVSITPYLPHTRHSFPSPLSQFGQVPWTHRFLLGNTTIANWFLGSASASQDDMIALANAQIAAATHRAAQEDEDEEEPTTTTTTTPSRPHTFLTRLLANARANPALLSPRDITTHAFGNISAGSDTTATALRAVFIHLLAHPPAHARLRAELAAAAQQPARYADAAALPYLAATIREAMRLHPSVGMLLERTADVPARLCGRVVPPRTVVGVNPWVVQRDGRVFDEPDAFVPERWLTGDEGRLRRMRRSFFAFGAGAHTCSGRWMAVVEMTRCVAAVVAAFDFELAGKGEGVGFTNRWFTGQYGLEVVVREREGGK